MHTHYLTSTSVRACDRARVCVEQRARRHTDVDAVAAAIINNACVARQCRVSCVRVCMSARAIRRRFRGRSNRARARAQAAPFTYTGQRRTQFQRNRMHACVFLCM